MVHCRYGMISQQSPLLTRAGLDNRRDLVLKRESRNFKLWIQLNSEVLEIPLE